LRLLARKLVFTTCGYRSLEADLLSLKVLYSLYFKGFTKSIEARKSGKRTRIVKIKFQTGLW
jgi:hypothetical protein